VPTVRGAARRLRAVLTPAPDPFALYMAEVEPALAAAPRVHRFAANVVVGGADTRAEPVTAAVAVDCAGAIAALEGAGEEWVLLTAPQDTLSPLAVERFGQAVALAPGATLITCDEDELTPAGARVSPRLRPGPSPDLMLACDGFGAALCVARAAALEALARCEEGPAWRYELALRLAGPDGAGHAHTPVILCHRGAGATAPGDAAETGAAQRVLSDRGEPGARVEAIGPRRRRIRRPVPEGASVEAIVLFRDKPELLRRCARSVLDRSTHPHLTLRLLDNGSEQAETAALVAELAADERVHAMRDDGPFNFAALNNTALAESRADFVVFLNNDTEVITEAWAQEMAEEAARPEVGAVAPLLLYPDGSVQHAGAAMGLHGYAGHPFAGLAPEASTPFGSPLDGTRNWLAVTAACMMVERSKLEAAGGFDESFVVAGNDVDLCLGLTERGHRSLCLPHVRMLHDESQSRGAHIDPQDFVRSEARYGEFRTVGDPFYNPSLTLTRTDCSLRAPGEAP
jgi:GT2 family glycosyltransferase